MQESRLGQGKSTRRTSDGNSKSIGGDVHVTMSVGFVAVADVRPTRERQGFVVNVRYQIEMFQRDQEIMKRVVGRVFE